MYDFSSTSKAKAAQKCGQYYNYNYSIFNEPTFYYPTDGPGTQHQQ